MTPPPGDPPTLAAAAEDPKVVDNDDAGEEANANAKGENVIYLITTFPSVNLGV